MEINILTNVLIWQQSIQENVQQNSQETYTTSDIFISIISDSNTNN